MCKLHRDYSHTLSHSITDKDGFLSFVSINVFTTFVDRLLPYFAMCFHAQKKKKNYADLRAYFFRNFSTHRWKLQNGSIFYDSFHVQNVFVTKKTKQNKWIEHWDSSVPCAMRWYFMGYLLVSHSDSLAIQTDLI